MSDDAQIGVALASAVLMVSVFLAVFFCMFRTRSTPVQQDGALHDRLLGESDAAEGTTTMEGEQEEAAALTRSDVRKEVREILNISWPVAVATVARLAIYNTDTA